MTEPVLPRSFVPYAFVAGAACQYAGAAIGVFLFDVVSPAAVAWLRAAGAAVVLLAWRRPWRIRWTRRTAVAAGCFGVVTVAMNVMFYEAIARIPLGTAVAIEFLGPVVVAAIGSRRARDRVAVAGAATGVVLLAGVEAPGPAGLIGVGFALASAALWASYILLGKRVADAGGGLDSLAVGMAVAAVVLAPALLTPALLYTPGAFTDPRVWLLGAGVGVLSSVLPYAIDQVVLRSVGQARFALLLALLPATAAIVGALVLAQVPTAAEAAGIGLVVAAMILGATGTRARGFVEAPP